MEGKNQETAAAMAGMSVRSARHWQSGPLPSKTKAEHWWRTRPDPFDGVWEGEIEPLLRGEGGRGAESDDHYRVAGGASSRPVQRVPAADAAAPPPGLARSARPGPGGVLPPGASAGPGGQVDFTHCNSLGVTIGGRPYRHLLFHFVLCYSGWRYAEAASGETFLALKQGLQGALWALGGAPEVVRSDNAAALTHEIRRSRGRALNESYAALLDHYGCAPRAPIPEPATKTAWPSTPTTGSRTPWTRH